MKRKGADGTAVLGFVLQANLEYYPKSARTYQAMPQAKNTKGDKQGAIKDLEKDLELDPKNTQARNQLQQLK